MGFAAGDHFYGVTVFGEMSSEQFASSTGKYANKYISRVRCLCSIKDIIIKKLGSAISLQNVIFTML